MQYIETRYVSAELKKRLRKNFPGVGFSVKIGVGTGADRIHVRWTDGPDEAEVRNIAAPLHSPQPATVLVEGAPVTGRPNVGGISYHRTTSAQVLQRAAELWSRHHDGATPGDDGIAGAFAAGDQVIPEGWPSNQVGQIARRVILPQDWAAATKPSPAATTQPAAARTDETPPQPSKAAANSITHTPEDDTRATDTEGGDGEGDVN